MTSDAELTGRSLAGDGVPTSVDTFQVARVTLASVAAGKF